MNRKKVRTVFLSLLVFLLIITPTLAASMSWNGNPGPSGLNSIESLNVTSDRTIYLYNKINATGDYNAELRLLKDVWWGWETMSSVRQYQKELSMPYQVTKAVYKMHFRDYSGKFHNMNGKLYY